MSKLTYDKNCRYCKRINLATYLIVEVLAGLFIGFHTDELLKIVIAATAIQPVVWLSFWIVDRTLPMSHHMLLSEDERK